MLNDAAVPQSRYTLIYSAPHVFEAHFVRSVLESHGLRSEVHNENLGMYGGRGVEVWVETKDQDEAREVLSALAKEPDGRLSLTSEEPEQGAVGLAPEGEERDV